MVIYSTNCKVRNQKPHSYVKKMVRDMADQGVSFSTHCDQIMDIEKYYAAFPPLTKPVSTDWKATTVKPSDYLNSNNRLSVTAENNNINLERKPTHPKTNHHSHQTRAGTANQNLRNGHHAPYISHHHHKHSRDARILDTRVTKSSTETRKHHHHQNHQQQQQRQRGAGDKKKRIRHIKVRDSKPWKHLDDVSESPTNLTILKQDSKPDREVKQELKPEQEVKLEEEEEEKWLDIGDDEFEAILTSDYDAISQLGGEPATIPDFSYIWREEAGDSCDLAAGDSLEAEVPSKYTKQTSDQQLELQGEELVGAVGGSKLELSTSWLSEYRDIESQLSTILLDSDSEEEYDSKYMHMFTPNPLSYMIRKGAHKIDPNRSERPAIDFSCKHCEQSYEVVLEAEVKNKKPSVGFGLFSHIDSRLDFDWTKYHPPPWSVYAEDDLDPNKKNYSSTNCDCQYCRSRIWRHVCKACSTPL